MRNFGSVLKVRSLRPLRFWLAALLIGSALNVRPVSAQTVPVTAGAQAKTIVTVEAQHGKDVPSVYRQDVVVREGSDRDPVTSWVPLDGEHAGMDLMILLDDGSDTYLGVQLADIRNFINAQPATTKIAVGYMRNGTVETAQDFTPDHAAAAKALRLPMGTPGNSPYFSLMDLIKRWPNDQERREILLVSDGIDPGEGVSDPYVDSVIEQAQKGRILIYTIYASGPGRYAHDIQRTTLGQNNLSRLAGETGAEAYFQGFHTAIAFAPFLLDVSAQLNHQYLLTFTVKPERKDSFHHVKLETEIPNAELTTADRVYASAAPDPR